MRRFTSLFLTLTLICSIGITAFASDNSVGATIGVVDESTIVDNNYGVIIKNYGIVTNNIRENNLDATQAVIKENYGTVTNNGNTEVYAIVEINEAEGTVENNRGTVDTNDGTVTNNYYSGQIRTNNGTVENNRGTVLINNDTVVTNEAYIENNYASVGTNNLKIVTNHSGATVDKNSKTATITDNQGTVTENYGTVTNTGNGTVESNYGTVIEGEKTYLGTEVNNTDGADGSSLKSLEKGVMVDLAELYQRKGFILTGYTPEGGSFVESTTYTPTAPAAITLSWKANPIPDDAPPATGDSNHTGLLMILLALSVCGIFSTVAMKRNK